MMNNLIVLTVSHEMLAANSDGLEQSRLDISNQVGDDTEVIIVPHGIEATLESKYEMYSGSKTVGGIVLTGTFRTNEELINWLDGTE